ncbi:MULTISPECIES: Rrf2 family transcriptional regulator [Vitreoscilla]|uniref:Rrf2 family transcriptional regulator n=1 Tax=Vitreoscilla stercoraria TaxID=61 RepID=A0ABY4E810_VITST|nr:MULTISPECIES: Rrf2 family transcriptional regulator [Vitreoscilla]AUZ04375.2 Rrf2-like transcriptional regulator [Vitreoscilla sp. C1]UOO91897.1 Rrf2 family transcriptional regulator [Vitreoscilla stercoraria]
MRLTTKGRFAVSAMLDLALYGQDNAVSLTAISERQHISLAYLEQLFVKLRRAQLVKSIRGPGGGYVLNRTTNDISIACIVNAVEDGLDATQCGGKGNCHGEAPCMTHHLWENLNKTIDNYLSNIHLDDLVKQQHAPQEHAVRFNAPTIS